MPDEPTLPGTGLPAPEADADADAREESPGVARTGARSVSEEHLLGILESLLFVSDHPVTAGELAQVARAETREVRRLLVLLQQDYQGRGVQLEELAGAWQFRSAAANAPFVREFLQVKPVRLTRQLLETLAVVAYRQPITRPEVDDIRGVDSGATLKTLLERGLIRMIGRKEEPGRPMLYATTGHFLEFFGLRSLRDLPMLREYTELSDESQATLASELGGEAAAAPADAPAAATVADPVPAGPEEAGPGDAGEAGD